MKIEIKGYNNNCLRLAHSVLDGFDTLLIGILDGDVVAEEIFRKQLASVVDYVEILNIDMDNKGYRSFRNRAEQFNFILETLEEQGHPNLLVAKITRALCRQVDNQCTSSRTNITEEQFYKVLEHIKGIGDEDEAMRNTLIGDLQTLGFGSDLFIPLTHDGFMTLKEVIGGMLGARKYIQSVEHLNEITRRYNGLVKYEGISELDEEVKEDLKYISTNLKNLIEKENDKRLQLFGVPLFE